MITGSKHSFTDFNIRAIKTNASGNEQWSKLYGGTGEDRSSSSTQTSDGGFIITGKTESYGAGSKDVWLIKTDSSGNKQWDQTFGGTGDEYGFSVIQTSDDGFVIAGYTDSYGAGNSDVWLIYYNPACSGQETPINTTEIVAYVVLMLLILGGALFMRKKYSHR